MVITNLDNFIQVRVIYCGDFSGCSVYFTKIDNSNCVRVIYFGGILMGTLASLDNAPWAVALSGDDRAAYLVMVKAEGAFLKALEALGCAVLRPERQSDRPSRRGLAVVPPGVPLPSVAALRGAVEHWRATLEAAALDQGKADTVGKRGATMPVWIGLDGVDVHLTDARPDYQAAKITQHLQPAYRGSAISPGEALTLLQDRLERTGKALQHSEAKSKKDRLDDQRQRFAELTGGVEALRRYILNNLAVSARLHSGLSWRINIRTANKLSIATTIATVALVPGSAATGISDASKRYRGDDPTTETILLPGGLEVRIRSA